MRLLIIECGSSKIAAAITAVAMTLRPKADMVSTMNLDLERFQAAEFKHMLYHLAPDTIILNPPDFVVVSPNWATLLKEITRHAEVTSGRVLFISSVEVLGDSYQRTEDAVEMPHSELGMFLQPSETEIENGTPRHYIIRLPYTVENKQVLSWVDSTYSSDGREVIKDNQLFTLITLEDAAKAIVDRIQTGLYGKFHITPNDQLALSDLVAMEVPQTKIPNQTLRSKYHWNSTPSEVVWDELYKEKYGESV